MLYLLDQQLQEQKLKLSKEAKHISQHIILTFLRKQ